ncbi:hypothetical protein BD310DRAFT_721060 [Dichomitus squalens]|uniref:Uncharacterized protein n=1 Tax=Dichomitus squalens TaxID=114155 RepID=A0A4Q9PL87_9APHY|nr:hypothetical protein BD310DRAFT_721060 [Dichomitus squalens]
MTKLHSLVFEVDTSVGWGKLTNAIMWMRLQTFDIHVHCTLENQPVRTMSRFPRAFYDLYSRQSHPQVVFPPETHLIDKSGFMPKSSLVVSIGGRWVACYVGHDVISLWSPLDEAGLRNWVALDVELAPRSIIFSPNGRQLLVLCSRQTFM